MQIIKCFFEAILLLLWVTISIFEQHFHLFEHSKGSVKVCLTLEADVISDKICWLRYLNDITGFKDLNIKVSSGIEWNYQWVSGKAGHQPGLCVDHLWGRGWDEKLTCASCARCATCNVLTCHPTVCWKSVKPTVLLRGRRYSTPYWLLIQDPNWRLQTCRCSSILNRKEMKTTCTPHGKPSKLGLQADFEWTAIT